jgi:spermidine synthase
VLDRPPERLAILGFAAGTTARAYAKYFPGTSIDGVEIDGELLKIAREHFGVEQRAGLRLFAEDARPFLRRASARYDAIFMDAYRQPYVPFYLATREFFELARQRLRPGGVLIVNVGHPETSTALERTLTATLRTVFPHVRRDPIESRNTLLVAATTAPTAQSLRRVAARLHPDLQPLARAGADRLAMGLSGGAVYTDDRAPVEWLIDRSIIRYAAGR